MIGVSSCLEAEINQQALDDSELRDQTAISSQSQTEKTFNSSSESRFGTMRNASVLSPLQNRTKIFNSVSEIFSFQTINWIRILANRRKNFNPNKVQWDDVIPVRLVKKNCSFYQLIIIYLLNQCLSKIALWSLLLDHGTYFSLWIPHLLYIELSIISTLCESDSLLFICIVSYCNDILFISKYLKNQF